jgi:hypothetical protein
MGRRCEVSRFVPSIACGDDAQLVQMELRNRMLRQRQVSDVRRIERSTKHAKSLGVFH